MRTRIGALIFVVAVVASACGGGGGGGGGGGASSAAPGGGGGAAVTAEPAVCASLKPLQTAIATLGAIKPTDSPINLNMAANGLATQLATFVSGAPGDLRKAAEPLKAAIQSVRDAIASAKSDPGALTTAIQGAVTAWKDLEAKIKAACPGT